MYAGIKLCLSYPCLVSISWLAQFGWFRAQYVAYLLTYIRGRAFYGPWVDSLFHAIYKRSPFSVTPKGVSAVIPEWPCHINKDGPPKRFLAWNCFGEPFVFIVFPEEITTFRPWWCLANKPFPQPGLNCFLFIHTRTFVQVNFAAKSNRILTC